MTGYMCVSCCALAFSTSREKGPFRVQRQLQMETFGQGGNCIIALEKNLDKTLGFMIT